MLGLLLSRTEKPGALALDPGPDNGLDFVFFLLGPFIKDVRTKGVGGLALKRA